ncbi:MAG: phosphatidate cytidylyltransferase [Actinobacteria bacterium]|nr:phosphatidate cytidylyltransferase [Actinomycetota bacterium]
MTEDSKQQDPSDPTQEGPKDIPTGTTGTIEKPAALHLPKITVGNPAGFGKNELLPRIITGVIYASVITFCLLLGEISTLVLVITLSGFCAYEFYRMMHIDGKNPNDAVGIVAAMLYPAVVYLGGIVFAISLTMVLMTVMLIWYVFYPRSRITDIALTIFGSLYCGLMLATLVLIRMMEPGILGGYLAFGIVLSVWANDSFAYLIGSKFGKHKLAPKISPKKSWEGFIGGAVGSIAIWMLLPIFVPDLSYLTAFACGVVCGVIAVFGDFVESRIKRGAGVKDSGNILPGHGGLLDRCDSLIFVATVAYVMLAVGGIL